MSSDYIPVLIYIVLAVGLAVALLVVTHLLGPKKPDPEKLDVYECGVPPIGGAHLRFSVKFYLIAMLFVLFDIEAIFLYPWAIVFKTLLKSGNFIFFEMVVFIGILLAGLFYAWKRGALDWE
ncbi:MAG: NADH-quinone oxidoreductase subunit A [bacterium]